MGGQVLNLFIPLDFLRDILNHAQFPGIFRIQRIQQGDGQVDPDHGPVLAEIPFSHIETGNLSLEEPIPIFVVFCHVVRMRFIHPAEIIHILLVESKDFQKFFCCRVN